MRFYLNPFFLISKFFSSIQDLPNFIRYPTQICRELRACKFLLALILYLESLAAISNNFKIKKSLYIEF